MGLLMAEQFSATDLRRFWAKVRRTDGCWEWSAARNHRGYGQFKVPMMGTKNQMQQAHRVSWVMHYSDIPAGLHVCHHCDNPACVRPDHLFLGTDADNCADKMRKGRHVPVRKPRKLTAEQVRQLFALSAEGLSQVAIAARVGCSRQLVSRYQRGEIHYLRLVA